MPATTTRRPKTKTTIGRTSTGSVTARIDLAPDDPTRNTNLESVRIFLSQALRRFNLASSAETYNRTEGMIDLEMVDGEGQWDPDVRSSRRKSKRPCLTINRFIPMIAHVANELRSGRPAIQIDPVGSGADPESAQIRQGLIRHIERDSDAESIYDAAFDGMLEKGWSWLRVNSEYENETSFDQVLKIEGFENDFCVYVDPTAKHPTRRDMKWAFIIDDVPMGEYKETYPHSKAATSLSAFSGIGDDAADWLSADSIRVAEYFWVDEKKATLYRQQDGRGVWADDLKEVLPGFYVDRLGFEMSERGLIDPEAVPLIKLEMDGNGKPVQRESVKRAVKWCKINAVEILEGNEDLTDGLEWKGKYIPLIQVQGRVKNIRGQRRLAGMVRNNRDAQRMYNYWVTAFTEMVALAPKSPWTAAAGQIEKYKKIWDTANDEAWPYLPYDPVSVGGQLVGPPQRQTFEPPVNAIISAIRQADNDLKAGFNIYDAALGQKGPQESGKAILARTRESESGNYNWIDNMKKAIEHVGEILLDLIPTRYDAARTITIVRPDSKQEVALINQEFVDPKGNRKLIDMAKGTYSCVAQVESGDGTKRQEAVAAMMQLIQSEPQLFSVIGDLVVAQMDWPGADAIVERLRKALPPNLQENKEGEEEMSPAVRATIEKGQVLIQTLEQRIGQMEKERETKQLEIESKEKIAAADNETKIVTAEIAASVKREVAGLDSQIKALQGVLDTWMDAQVTHEFNPETGAMEPLNAASA